MVLWWLVLGTLASAPASITPIGAGFSFWSITGWRDGGQNLSTSFRQAQKETVETRYGRAKAWNV
jgi:hypothetical protein